MTDNKAFESDVGPRGDAGGLETTYFGAEEVPPSEEVPPPSGGPPPAYDSGTTSPTMAENKQGQTQSKGDSTEVIIEPASGAVKAQMYSDQFDEPIRATKPYAGMGKEDLLRFSDTPFWNRFRVVCLVIFWLGWLALLGAVIGLTIVAPRCSSPPEPSWWQKSSFYQVYVRSFYDSDGDGVGDIKGLTSKLGYLKDSHVTGVLVSSVYNSHNDSVKNDYGYEVTNHREIDATYGTDEDFQALIQEAHDMDLKIIMDFVPNHSGTNHEWFKSSSANGSWTNPFWNYYVWADCGTGDDIPNNWLSLYGGSAWTYDAARQQCYLHQGFETQPELNLHSSGVKKELDDILRYWLDKGVDGFRVMSSHLLYEDTDLQNEADLCTDGNSTSYECRDHSKTSNQPENHDIIARWRAVLSEYENSNGSRVLITDLDTTSAEVLQYYGTASRDPRPLPNNYLLREVLSAATPEEFKDDILKFISDLPNGATATWLLGSQDRPRLGEGEDDNLLNALTVLQMTLPGVPITYYGDEIGMRDGKDGGHDPAVPSRDAFRSPMQWDASDDAGFINPNASGNADPWLDVNPDNVFRNTMNDTAGSVNAVYKHLAGLRDTQQALQIGNFDVLTVEDDVDVVAYVREFEGFDRLLIAVNLGDDATPEINFATARNIIPNEADVVMTTSQASDYAPGDAVNMRQIQLKSLEAAVFTWPYSR